MLEEIECCADLWTLPSSCCRKVLILSLPGQAHFEKAALDTGGVLQSLDFYSPIKTIA
jgi:hypothetical protein